MMTMNDIQLKAALKDQHFGLIKSDVGTRSERLSGSQLIRKGLLVELPLGEPDDALLCILRASIESDAKRPSDDPRANYSGVVTWKAERYCWLVDGADPEADIDAYIGVCAVKLATAITDW